MAKVGYPLRLIVMVRQFHDDMQARVQNDGGYSKSFPLTNRVKQDCLMTAPNENTKVRSFKSSQKIQKKECGSDCTVSNNKFSSVTLNDLAVKIRESIQ